MGSINKDLCQLEWSPSLNSSSKHNFAALLETSKQMHDVWSSIPRFSAPSTEALTNHLSKLASAPHYDSVFKYAGNYGFCKTSDESQKLFEGLTMWIMQISEKSAQMTFDMGTGKPSTTMPLTLCGGDDLNFFGKAGVR